MTVDPTDATETTHANVPGAAQFVGLVLVCGDSSVSSDLVDMTIARDHWRIQVIDGLCKDPSALSDAIAEAQIDRLVVALCQGSYSKTEIVQRSRRAGIGVFGTHIIDIPAAGSKSANKAGAVTGVRGGMARIEALKDPQPENVKSTFFGGGEKISRRALFTIPPIDYRPVPTVDRTLCIAGTGCSQCETACPHDAIKNSDGTTIVDMPACQSCGICVTACPQRAIEFPGHSPDEIESHVAALLQDTAENRLNIAFACSKSASTPIDEWQIVPVACAAMTPASALLSAISAGASSVGILRCVEQCSQQSTDKVKGRADYARRVLQNAGLDPARVVDMAPSDAGGSYVAPSVSANAPVQEYEVSIFGSTASSSTILALSVSAPEHVESFVHPHSPVGIPVVDASTCTMCGTCSTTCPTGALTQIDSNTLIELRLDATKCIACNECVSGCPEVSREAIRLELKTDVNILRADPVILNSDRIVRCETCGTGFTSVRTLKRIEDLLGSDYSEDLYGKICPECRVLS